MFFYERHGKLAYQRNCVSALETRLFWKITELDPNYKNQPFKFQQLLTRDIVGINQKRWNCNYRMVSVSALWSSMKHQLSK